MENKQKIFVVYGSNFSKINQAIEGIRKRVNVEPSVFNSCAIYSKEAEVIDLSKVLLSGNFSGKKIIVFRDFDFLNKDCREFLFENIAPVISENYLIFQTEKDYYLLRNNKKFTSDNFFGFLNNNSTIISAGFDKRALSVEDFIACLRRRNLVEALYCVESLFKDNSKAKSLGPQLMGILISQTAYQKDLSRKSADFRHLWQADRLMKEAGADPRLVIQTLLVKLLN
jgi:hypothetical protein